MPRCKVEALPVGRAARGTAKRWPKARTVPADRSASGRTTVKVPSMFSSKCCVRSAFACSEPVPGTASEVVRRPGSRTAENTPATITSAHNKMTTTRRLMTARAQRSSTSWVEASAPKPLCMSGSISPPYEPTELMGQFAPWEILPVTSTEVRYERWGRPAIPEDVERPRVLCVDDEQLVLEGLRAALQRVRGHGAGRIGQRSDRGAAIRRPLRGDPISDMNMPGMDGVEVLPVETTPDRPDTSRIPAHRVRGARAGAGGGQPGQHFPFLGEALRQTGPRGGLGCRKRAVQARHGGAAVLRANPPRCSQRTL